MTCVLFVFIIRMRVGLRLSKPSGFTCLSLSCFDGWILDVYTGGGRVRAPSRLRERLLAGMV